MISFQNCSKVHPEILIDDKLTASGLNTDEIDSPAQVSVNIGQVPAVESEEDSSTPVVHNPNTPVSSEEPEAVEEEDVLACQDQSKGHQVILDAQHKVYDADLDQNGGGTTYISVADNSVIDEIKNTHGKTVLCGVRVKKISNNVGSLILINSYADSLDMKKGNLCLRNSTVTAISNMKGVIKK